MNHNIELEAAEVLLDLGISFPLKEWRIPFTQRTFSLRLTLRRPTLGARIRIAREYLAMDVSTAEMEGYDKEQQLAFVANHGAAMSRIVSYALVRSPWLLWAIPLVAWWLRWWCDERMLALIFLQFLRCMGTEDFIRIIASVERTNPLTPTTSHHAKGS